MPMANEETEAVATGRDRQERQPTRHQASSSLIVNVDVGEEIAAKSNQKEKVQTHFFCLGSRPLSVYPLIVLDLETD